jgi:hypothetical protein
MKEEKKSPSGKRKKNFPDIEITELFMAKRGKKGWDTCFHGVIHREKDDEGNETGVNGTIFMPGEGMIWSRDTDQWKYGENLDDIVELRLDHNIHSATGVTSELACIKYFHN